MNKCPKCGATLVDGIAGLGPSCPNLCTLEPQIPVAAPRVFHEAVAEAMPLESGDGGTHHEVAPKPSVPGEGEGGTHHEEPPAPAAVVEPPAPAVVVEPPAPAIVEPPAPKVIEPPKVVEPPKVAEPPAPEMHPQITPGMVEAPRAKK